MIGCESPRIFTPPKRKLTPETSAGFSMIDFSRDVLGIEPLPWQRFFLIHAFELNESGKFRFRTILLMVARQNGKTTVAQIIVCWFLYVYACRLVIGASQSLDLSEETWEDVVDIVESNPELSALVADVKRVNGKKSLKLTNGAKYKIVSASRRGGRGKSGDLVLLDELREQQNFEAWAAISKTTLAIPNAVILCMTNAGDETSVVLRHLRAVAHKPLGDPDGWCKAVGAEIKGLGTGTTAIFEWSAHPGCEIDDRKEWSQANPSLGYTITEEALEGAFESDTETVFRTECLCQFVERIIVEPFPEGSWAACLDPMSYIAPDSPLFFGVDVSINRTFSTIAVCGYRPDGCLHIEIAERRTGTDWLRNWFETRAINEEIKVAYQGKGAPVSDIGSELGMISGVQAVACEGTNLTNWCGRFYDCVAASSPDEEFRTDAVNVYHLAQPVLDTAATIAAKRNLGDGVFVFDRKNSVKDIAPLMACTMALGLLIENEKESANDDESVYELHGLRMI